MKRMTRCFRQFHQAAPVQGIPLRARERLIYGAGAGRIRDDLQRPGFGHESDLAQLLRREFGNACFSLIQDEGAVERSEVFQFSDRLL